MTQMNHAQDDEIDLFELFQTLWDGKWKIIATTFIASVIGFFSVVVKPNSFEISIPFKSGKQSVFYQYTLLNKLLRNNNFSLSIDDESMFKMFIEEFNDYEEMVDSVSASEFVQKSIKDLDDEDKQKALIGLAKSFELKALSKDNVNGVLSFEWNNASEGLRLANDAIQKTLINIRNATKSNVDNLAFLLEARNTQELKNLRSESSFILQKQIVLDKKRIQYLIEQSAIAKELGIEANRLGEGGTIFLYERKIDSKTDSRTDSRSDSSNGVPYYLRGYKAIDKEISIIENRTEEERLLNNNGYFKNKLNIILLEKDFSVFQLRNASKMVETDNPNDWVEFDLAIAEVKPKKYSILYVFLSIVLGGLVGVIYVLISNAIRKRKEQLVKV